jgi:hypothetical protein
MQVHYSSFASVEVAVEAAAVVATAVSSSSRYGYLIFFERIRALVFLGAWELFHLV